MTNVLFDRETLKVTGLNRPALAFEVEINNVDLSSIPDKQATIVVSQDKKDENGKQLYKLHQPDRELTQDVSVQVETMEETDQPIMFTETTKVPILDENGNQVVSHVYGTRQTTDKSDPNTGETNPPDMNGDIQATDEEGNLLYMETYIVTTNKCYTTDEQQVQKVDDEGNKLFYKTEAQTIIVGYEPQVKEITEEDPEFTEELEKATEEVEQPISYKFSDNPEEFTYVDLVKAKETQITNGTLYSHAVLFEQFNEDNVDVANTHADYIVDKLSLPVDGTTTFKEVTLPSSVSSIKIAIESNISGFTIKVNGTDVDKNNEVWFTAPTNKVVIEIDKTGKRVDICSLAILS